MFKNMKLGTKLILSFLSVALITLLLGALGYYGAAQSEASIDEIGAVRLPSVDSMLEINRCAEKIGAGVRTLAIPGLPKEVRQRQYDDLAQVRTEYQEAWDVYEPLPQTTEEAQYWSRFVPAWEAWRVENNKAMELCRKFDELNIQNPDVLEKDLEAFRGDHYALEANVFTLLQDQKAFDGGEDHTTCAFGQWMSSQTFDNPELKAHLHSCNEPHRHFHASVKKIKQLVTDGKVQEAQAALQQEMMPAAGKVFGHFDEMIDLSEQAVATLDQAQHQILGPVTERKNEAIGLLSQIVQVNRDAAAQEVETAHSQAAFLKIFSLTAMVIGVVIAVALGVLITRAITKPIRRIISDLTEGAEQVSSASGQVSAASQSLAEGATEQAAGLEETSSSLEEMSSMTKQNADNAQQANSLAGEARKAAEGGAESMERMSRAIDDIQKSSDETAKIIKVIDEIAFQTNLLALNAAVEAARAGEAGKGFAVVAEEVRNLAMRSAEAAKNTSNMIEGSVKNARNGVEISGEVSKALQEIVDGIAKTSDLVGEITAASQEQAQGIDQVNTAVSQMDKVTQQNAANAEESASASEELSAQAEQMQGIVGELVSLVEGANARIVSRRPASSHHPRSAAKPKAGLSDHAFHQIAGGGKKTAPKTAKAAIPLDDDFRDFNS